MLFKTRDTRGKEHWVNARFVRAVRAGRKGGTELWVAGEPTPIKLDYPIDQVAEVVNAALSLGSGDAPEDDAATNPAANAAMLLILAG